MAYDTDLLDQIRKVVREENEPIKKRLDELEQGQEQTNTTLSRHDTILEALKAGQDDIRENMATKQDVERVEKEVDKLKKRLPPYRAD